MQLPDTLTVHIRPDHIEYGSQSDRKNCPMVQAILAALNIPYQVGHPVVVLSAMASIDGIVYNLPTAAGVWIKRYDNYGEGDPETFTLTKRAG